MFGIIVKNYEHHNRSFPNWDSPKGKYIGSKKQYDEEMAKWNFQPYQAKTVEQKKWKPSEKLKKSLYHLKDKADKKGNIRVDDGFVNQLKDAGVSFNPKFMTDDLKGGVDASS